MKVVNSWKYSNVVLKLRLLPLKFDESCDIMEIFKFGSETKAIAFEV